MSAADQLVFEDSLSSETPSTPFSDKSYVFVIDQNQGSYSSNQVLIDTTSLSTNDRFAMYSEGYIELPTIISVNAGTMVLGNAGTPASFNGQSIPFGIGIKNGWHHLVHSVQVDYNGKTVVQQTPFTNAYTSFRLLSTLSQEDVQKYGASIGFAKDTATSWRYSAAGSADGQYVSNNRNHPSVQVVAGAVSSQTAVSTGATHNAGLLERQMHFNQDLVIDDQWKTFMSASNAGQTGKGYYSNVTGAGYKAWYAIARLRLKDLSSFFDEMPLVRGAQMKITLTLNTGSITLTGAATPTMTPAAANVSMSNGTCPFMIASSAANQGMNALVANAAGTFTVNLSVGRVSNSALLSNGVTHPSLQACRLYVPMYQFSPEFAQQYLTLGTKRKVTFREVTSFQVNNISAGGVFNSLLSNGLPNPKRLIILPFQSTTMTPAVISPLLSPFDTAPATTTPMVSLTQLNVQVAGRNVWASNAIYDYEDFMHELSETGLNGGKTTGLSSGLLSELDFSQNYRFYVCNLGRRLPNELDVPKSVSITGTNNSQVALDLLVFVEYEKAINVDVATGQWLE